MNISFFLTRRPNFTSTSTNVVTWGFEEISFIHIIPPCNTTCSLNQNELIKTLLINQRLFFFTYLLHRYWQLRVESTQLILSRKIWANILTTKSQAGNILSASGIWKRWWYHSDWQITITQFTNSFHWILK